MPKKRLSLGLDVSTQSLSAVVPVSKVFQPSPEDVTALHRQGGYLEKFSIEEARLIAEHTQKNA